MPPDGKKPAGGQTPGGEDAVYFETVPAGRFLRVTAICGRTGLEASVLGPSGGSRAALEQAALTKLRHALAKQKR